jgi:hypothetical protein
VLVELGRPAAVILIWDGLHSLADRAEPVFGIEPTGMCLANEAPYRLRRARANADNQQSWQKLMLDSK